MVVMAGSFLHLLMGEEVRVRVLRVRVRVRVSGSVRVFVRV